MPTLQKAIGFSGNHPLEEEPTSHTEPSPDPIEDTGGQVPEQQMIAWRPEPEQIRMTHLDYKEPAEAEPPKKELSTGWPKDFSGEEEDAN